MTGTSFKQKKKEETIVESIFPEGLRDKTLFRPTIKGNVQQMSEKGEGYHDGNPFRLVAFDSLEEYLETKNPDKMIDAIMHDYTIIQGIVINDLEAWDPKSMVGNEIIDLTILQMAHIDRLSTKTGTSEENLNLVTPPTVVWSTINYWRTYLTFNRASVYASDTQKYLERCFLRVGGALIPSIIPVADGVFTEEERKYRELKQA
tara:strand:+ start:765 stop:1376 length:612 start_codon:yes stop_codon:yes gene_type:complete